MVIVAFLLFWIGTQINAPWWYYFFLALYAVAEIFAIGVEYGERGEDDDS